MSEIDKLFEDGIYQKEYYPGEPSEPYAPGITCPPEEEDSMTELMPRVPTSKTRLNIFWRDYWRRLSEAERAKLMAEFLEDSLNLIENNKEETLEELFKEQEVTDNSISNFSVEASEQDAIAKAVNPAHYKCHIPASEVDYQWMHTNWFRAKKAAVRLCVELGLNQTPLYIATMQRAFYVEYNRMQADKYHTRFGQKDAHAQELQKTQWYLKAAELAYTGPFWSNGMPKLPDEV
jgi:hypothetical protein